jgi:hypothetical protein
MTNRKIIALVFCLTIVLISYSVWNLYYIMPTEKARPLIQNFLNKNYNNKFIIITIEKYYSKDLFKQPVGYNLTLVDTSNIELKDIKIQFNEYQKGWITYGGTDIEKEYENAKSQKTKGSRQH